ncbi:MAG TPA: aspartate ammonia-lyase [Anaerolineaceae bacterium]|nr:aspartate ammonia-lyase [Anaerolineaceae bacterium]
MDKIRIEKDSLGALEVPEGAYYGVQTQRAVHNFPISGMSPYPAFIWSMAAIKTSAAKVHKDLNFLPIDYADAIIQAGNEVMAGKWNTQFVVDPFQAGAGTSHNMNTNEVIANRATELLGGKLGEYLINPNDHVNMGQSTNDTIPTAIRLGCLWRLEELINVIKELAFALRTKSNEFDHIVKSGRTHLQDAVPVRLGQEFGAYARAVERDFERIVRSSEGLRRLGIGGTATGSGLNAHKEYHPRMVAELSTITGLALTTSDDLFESMQSMADMVDFSSSLRTIAVTLTRIANDFRLLSSGPATGLDEIRLPPVQPGSSIMPGKVNPVLAEMLNMAMYHVIGNDTTVSLAAQAGQLELNVMMPIIAHNLFEMMHVMIGSIKAFTTKCVIGIIPNVEKAQGWLEKNSILVTALNPLIGYQKGAELVKESIARNITIRELALEKVNQKQLLNKETQQPLVESDIEKLFNDLRKFTEGGILS